MPEDFDDIVDFVVVPENDTEKFKQINIMPAIVMKRLAKEYKAKKIGFIAGSFLRPARPVQTGPSAQRRCCGHNRLGRIES